MSRKIIDDFGAIEQPASCHVSVYPDKSVKDIVETLHYCVPLGGIVPTQEIFIHRSLESIIHSAPFLTGKQTHEKAKHGTYMAF